MKKTIALILIGLAALILIANVGFADGVNLNLLFGHVHAARSIVLLAAISLGVTIGLLIAK